MPTETTLKHARNALRALPLSERPYARLRLLFATSVISITIGATIQTTRKSRNLVSNVTTIRPRFHRQRWCGWNRKLTNSILSTMRFFRRSAAECWALTKSLSNLANELPSFSIRILPLFSKDRTTGIASE